MSGRARIGSRRGRRCRVVIGLCAALAAGVARGDVTLPSLISDNMVLQERSNINVWGKADPGETVTVQMGPDSAQTSAGPDGNWGVKLDGLKSGGPYDLTVSGKNSVTVHNVAVGEVWVCAGESNMEMKVVAARNGQQEMANANVPMVRVFVVKHASAGSPQADCEGTWVVCDPDTVQDLTATGFFFARELNQEMRVPFGLIQSAWGPSRAAAWTPAATLEKDPSLTQVLDRYQAAAANYPAALAAYQAKLVAWKDAKTAGTAANGPKPVAPLAPGGTRQPGGLYNAMIAPLTRFAIRGVLWDQGESDTVDPMLYRKLFPAMIGAWRKAWGEGDFPFFYVQAAGFLGRHAEPGESRWAELREAQEMALSVPKTGMVVSMDTGGEYEMHPADKQDVAHRLALLASGEVYGKDGVTAQGPQFAGMEIEDGKAVLTFTHTDGKLVARGMGSGGAVKGFQIAGADGRYVWADAEIHGDKVTVQSKETPQPVSVRYGWADYTDGNLANAAGLPAGSFRTDGAGVVAGVAAPAETPGRKHHRKRTAERNA